MFSVYPSDGADWVREDKIPSPPSEYSTRNGPGSVSDDVAIIAPSQYEYVAGLLAIQGNARSGSFKAYKLAYGQGLQPQSFQQIAPEHGNQISNGVLEQWDTTGLEGVYTLQLSVIEQSGNFRQMQVPVFVDNISPTVKVTYPFTDDTFIAIKEGDSDKIRIQAEAVDNVSMGHVEFYMDGNLLGESSVAPYNILWPIVLTPTITAAGWEMITVTHIITATAFDAAGNISTSQEILIHVAPEPPKKKTSFLWYGEAGLAQDERWVWRRDAPLM